MGDVREPLCFPRYMRVRHRILSGGVGPIYTCSLVAVQVWNAPVNALRSKMLRYKNARVCARSAFVFKSAVFTGACP